MNLSPKITGLFQAAGLTLYVILFVLSAWNVGQWFEALGMKTHPVLNMTVVLMAFVTSASICGTIMFTAPVLRFLDGRKNEAIQIVLWTIGWLLTFFAIVIAVISVLSVAGF